MKKIFNVAAFVCGMDEEYPYQIIKGINEFARNHAINISYFASFGGVVENSSFDDGEYSIYKLAQLTVSASLPFQLYQLLCIRLCHLPLFPALLCYIIPICYIAGKDFLNHIG